MLFFLFKKRVILVYKHLYFVYHRVSMKRCQQCKRAFWDDKVLEKHILTHNRSREFICSYCQKSFFKCARKNLRERTCDSNPNREIKEYKQIGRGSATDNLVLDQEAFDGAIKRYHYYFQVGLEFNDFYEKTAKYHFVIPLHN